VEQTFSNGKHITGGVEAADVLRLFKKITVQQHYTAQKHPTIPH